jgi:hypothetical protein
MLEKIRCKRDIFVFNAPLFSHKHGAFLNRHTDEDRSQCRALFDEYWDALCKGLNATYVVQPEKTIANNGICSKEIYIKDDGYHLSEQGISEYFQKLAKLIN